MPRIVIAAAILAIGCADGKAQKCGADLAGAKALEAPEHILFFRTDPAKIAVGRHFGIDIVVCAGASAAKIERISIDGFMPEHRHGMNYKPSIKALGSGRFRADGMMFHMPGRWEFRFDIQDKNGSERLTSSLVLR